MCNYDTDLEAKELMLPYLLFNVGKNTYGVNSEYVMSIETLTDVVTIVEKDNCIRGGVIYNDEFIHLLDLRKLFGMESQIDEFENWVRPDKRIKEHEEWMQALEKSVRERVDFTLTDDPRKCAFGRWYYSFKTDNNLLKHQLNAIEAPHEAIHNTAKIVKKLLKEKKYEEAEHELRKTQDTHFVTTIHILASMRDIVTNSIKELFIVIDAGGCKRGIIVDNIVGIEHINETLNLRENSQYTEYIEFIGRKTSDNTVVIALSCELLNAIPILKSSF